MIPLKDNIPTDRFPVVTVALIAINFLVFIFFQGPKLTLSESGDAVRPSTLVEWGAIPYRITHPGKKCGIGDVEEGTTRTEQVVCQGTSEYGSATDVHAQNDGPAFLTVLTSMFMHGGWLHIIFNMLFLWIFGGNIEDSMGRLRFVAFYLLGGLIAFAAQIAVDPSATAPTVGASGAIAGVLGGYALLYPRAKVMTLLVLIFFVTLVELPAMVMLGIWFVLQFLPAVGQLGTPEVGGSGGVAYFAHLGGFVFGLAMIKVFATRRQKLPGETRAAG